MSNTVAISKQTNEANEFVAKFLTDFHEKFGVLPHVSFDLGKDNYPYTIKDVADVINHLISQDEELSAKVAGATLKTQVRIREIVTYRQCFYKLGHDMNYGPNVLIKYTDQDHATAIHGHRKANELIASRDKYFRTKFTTIQHELKERIRTKAVLQDDNRSGVESGSGLHLI